MKGLPITFFERLGLDGKTLVACMLVCRDWNHQIRRSQELMRLVSMHHVRVESEDGLKKELFGNKIGDTFLVPTAYVAHLLGPLYKSFDLCFNVGTNIIIAISIVREGPSYWKYINYKNRTYWVSRIKLKK